MKYKLLTLDKIKERLSDRNLNSVAKSLGLHYNSVAQFTKKECNPNYKTLKAISLYLGENKWVKTKIC